MSASQSPKTVKIGGFSAFWGDDPFAARQLVYSAEGNSLDYLVGDYLAEVTLCILARMKQSRREIGYVAEFLTSVWKPLMADLAANGTKCVTNAGGMDAMGLARAMHTMCVDAKVSPMPKIAVVLGDDVLTSDFGKFHAFEGCWGGDEAMWGENDTLMSCNAYIGARPIAECLALGATVVITGRAVDSALILGPLMHEFGWKKSQYDLLSAGSLSGHLIECGCQVCSCVFVWTVLLNSSLLPLMNSLKSHNNHAHIVHRWQLYGLARVQQGRGLGARGVPYRRVLRRWDSDHHQAKRDWRGCECGYV
jgi:hypothetical protein